jgi:K+-transporting ATPase KdpF subunit
MGLVAAIAQHLGLIALAVIATVLVVYLSYSMLYPERF